MSEPLIEELFPGLYRLEIPIPQNPLGRSNSYVISRPEGHLVFDTTMNREECRSVMLAGLKKLNVDISRTDFFVSHFHSDHSGLAAVLPVPGSKCYCSRGDAAVINWQDVPAKFREQTDFLELNGLRPEEAAGVLKNHPGVRFGTGRYVTFTEVVDGQVIEAGDYRFRCVVTPGHTPGHMCLYEPERKIFLSADHVLMDITPNISLFSDDENPLGDYLRSLDKVSSLDVKYVLPGHRTPSTNFLGRIEELKKHHEHRTAEAFNIVADGPQNAYQVASHMAWDMSYKHWEDFPVVQKWFATGEALAHLKFLEVEGKLRRESRDGKLVYTPA